MVEDGAERPIRICAGALGEDRHGAVPPRDRVVAPGHAVLVADTGAPVLVAARLLVNGVTILCIDGMPPPAGRDRMEGGVALAADRAALLRVRSRLEARAGIMPAALRPLDGHLDQVELPLITGWAHDGGNPGCPVLLEISIDGAGVDIVLADRYRIDLAPLGLAGGYCAFEWTVPPDLDARRRRIVAVRRAADGADLRGSPVLVDCIEPAGALIPLMRAAPAELRGEYFRILSEAVARRPLIAR